MSEILAVLDPEDHREQVLAVAAALAETLQVPVRHLVLLEEDDLTTRSATVLAAIGRDKTLLSVLAGAAEVEALCWQVVTAARKPVVLVPTHPGRPVSRVSRVLLPLDGTQETAGAVTEAVELLVGAGVQLVALHVFDPHTVPAFWDQPAHTARAWSEEFLARNLADHGAELETRAGRPEREVSDAAVMLEADLLLMGWSQHVEPERAATVRAAVADGTVPVLLVPLAAGHVGRARS
jgi:nucleotide-binding universal stress UspA family protein